MLAPFVLLVITAPLTESSTAALDLPVPDAPEPALVPTESPDEAPDRLGPGAWLPKVGEGLEVGVGFRFGVGTDATEAIRDDPPYAAVIDFRGQLAHEGWYGTVTWGAQIAGPEANPPERGSQQTFLPWEIGIDAGYTYQPTRRWRLRPQIGVRAQPERLGPTTNSDVSGVLELAAERQWVRRAQLDVSSSVRLVGRYGPGDHDLDSSSRYRRTTCYLWGRRVMDCALAFTLAPGSVGAEGEVKARFGRTTAALWGGWLLAGRADEVNDDTPVDLAVPQDNGDWTWIGVKVAFAVADDIAVAAAALTGGRVRDSLDGGRVPLFTSDLARTTVVVHVVARL